MKFVFSIMLMSLIFTAQAGTKRIVAVFDFYDARGRTTIVGEKLSLLMFARLSENESIKMVERKDIDKVLKERKLRRSGLVSRDYMSIAALVNADYIVTGRIYDAEGGRIINLKLTKCADGKITGKVLFADPQKKDYLEKAAAQASSYIIKKMQPKKVRPDAPRVRE